MSLINITDITVQFDHSRCLTVEKALILLVLEDDLANYLRNELQNFRIEMPCDEDTQI